MLKQALMGFVCVLAGCGAVMAAAAVDDERPLYSAKPSEVRATDDSAARESSAADEPGIPADVEVVPLDPGAVFERVVVGPGGVVLSEGAGGTAGAERLIYSNTLGLSMLRMSANALNSDDLATLAPDGCRLSRFKFRVSGRVIPTDVGGAYTVKYSLYDTCPGSVPSAFRDRYVGDPEGGIKIPNTDGEITFADDGMREVVHTPGFLTPATIPTNVWLGIKFTRANCGVAIGAPAMVGTSADMYDPPGFPCNAFFGGFPLLPHASFWAEVYGDGCPESFLGYKCGKASSAQLSAGANVTFSDDIQLIVDDCQLIGYEVAVRNVANYTFDLRRDCGSNVIAGTQRTFAVNTSDQPQLQLARFTINPPIPLNTDRLFMGFKVDNTQGGVVLAGVNPVIGETALEYFVINPDTNECIVTVPLAGLHGSFHMSLTCAGEQPLGGCCDPLLTQCAGGADDGKRCPCNALCQGGPANESGVKCCRLNSDCQSNACVPFCAAPGSCEAVCRTTPEINCPFPSLRGSAQRPQWREGEFCRHCSGGPNAGDLCTTNAECPGMCRSCVGGTNAGAACTSDTQCPGGICGPQAPCECVINDPFTPQGTPCGVASCCHIAIDPKTMEESEVCTNMTKNECDAEPPLDRARLWQLGEYCGFLAQTCPRNACIAREGSCFSPHPQPGCNNPICCTKVCISHGVDGAYCCDVEWDALCVTFAEADCLIPPGNDECAPGARQEGALLIPVPGAGRTKNNFATANDPGFCCHEGVAQCIGGTNDGLPCVLESECPDGSCPSYSPNPDDPGYGSVWFKFVQPAGQTTALIHTCLSNAPALDSILQVYKAGDNSSPANACRSLSVIACNDDFAGCSSSGRNSRICVRNMVPGETYYIKAASKTPQRMGQIAVSVSAGCGSPPGDAVANDYCPNATVVEDTDPTTPLESVSPFTLNGATFDCPRADCSTTALNDVWFNYTATCTGEVVFETCGADSVSSPDTFLVVYEDCTRCPPSSGAPLGCNDNVFGSCGLASRVKVEDVVAGQCFKVRISDIQGFPVMGNLTIECTEIETCTPPAVTGSNPANCSIDARYPHAPGAPGTLLGWNSIQMTFADGCDVAGAVPGDFTIACNPAAGPPACPTITTVSTVDQTVTVNFSSVIPAGKWTCVTYTATGEQRCIGSLPADANSDRTAAPADILDIIDDLNLVRVPPLLIHQCDTDRSLLCQPPDILAIVDLLNGASGFVNWNGRTLPACPSAICGNGACEPGETTGSCAADCPPPP